MINIETLDGNIYYGENIIRTIVSKGVESLNDKAILYNYSKKLPGFVPGFGSRTSRFNMSAAAPANTVKIRYDEEEGLFIKVYLVVRFGSSIKNVTDSLIDYIYEYTEKITSMKPEKVTVSVTGVLSKNLVRRDIEVSR